MKKGQRPSAHIRRVRTGQGRRVRLINRSILKTNKKGIISNLNIELVRTAGNRSNVELPSIVVKRLNEYNSDLDVSIGKMLDIYSQANPDLVNIPSRDDIRTGNERYYFILKNSTIVGVGGVRIRTGEIQKVFILPSHRGRHYAPAFVKRMEELLKTRGVRRAVMFVKRDNTNALRVWERNGYTHTGESGPNDSLKLEKSLVTEREPLIRIEEVV